VPPSVLPIPLLTEVMIVDNAMPLQMPTKRVEMISAINAFNLTTVINSSNKIMEEPRITIGIIF
jgi:hypothetical protein